MDGMPMHGMHYVSPSHTPQFHMRGFPISLPNTFGAVTPESYTYSNAATPVDMGKPPMGTTLFESDDFAEQYDDVDVNFGLAKQSRNYEDTWIANDNFN